MQQDQNTMAGFLILLCKLILTNDAFVKGLGTFVQAILLQGITCFILAQQSWSTYVAGIFHGFAAVCVFLMIFGTASLENQQGQWSEAFIYTTASGSYICSKKVQSDVTGIGAAVWFAYLSSYTISVANCKLDARCKACWPQVKMDGVLKAGVPTNQEIEALAHELMESEIWKRLGRALGLCEPVIIQIQEDEHVAYEKAYRLLNKWRQVMGADANYESLAQALQCEQVYRPDLVQRFCYRVETQDAAGQPQVLPPTCTAKVSETGT